MIKIQQFFLPRITRILKSNNKQQNKPNKITQIQIGVVWNMLITMFWLTSFSSNKSEDTRDKMTALMKAVHKHLSFRVLAYQLFVDTGTLFRKREKAKKKRFKGKSRLPEGI